LTNFNQVTKLCQKFEILTESLAKLDQVWQIWTENLTHFYLKILTKNLNFDRQLTHLDQKFNKFWSKV